MNAGSLPSIAGWDNFYVIVGSSAGALIGLQFVVMTLIADAHRASSKQISAFGTPTVIHFCASLLIAALMSAPWESLEVARGMIVGFGGFGIAYSLRVIYHARMQKGYKPDIEDWFWYAALPMAAYVVLFVAGIILLDHTPMALGIVAAVALTLLFTGIHNAWDTVTYLIVTASKDKRSAQNPGIENEE